MKEANNKEIDLLLRDLAKRHRSARADSLSAGEHLDADELNSLAEGVLPEATRVLYTSHLADCDRCRKMVAQLMAASGGLVQTRTGSAKAGVWSFLSEIFTPKVLRFALPVLSLAIIAGIGIMVMRQPSQREFVAQVNTQSSQAEAPQPMPNNSQEQSSQTSSDKYAVKEPVKESPSPAKTGETKKAERGLDAEQTKSTNETVVEDKIKETTEQEKADKSAAKREVAQRPAETAAVVGGRADANTPKPQPETSKERAGFATGRTAPSDNLAKTSERKLRDQAEEEYRRDAAKKEAPAPASATTVTRSETKNKDEDQAAATRTVSGRRFRPSGKGWIDTAYESSMSLTNVARGSEQYRALIGDEPGLRVVAEQLSGQVIVVWKGKAYRIR
jgi:hypothetical protein